MSDKSLESFVEEVSGTSHLRVEHDFGDGFVRLRTSEAERRQAIQDIRSVESIVLELLRNSRDAHATKIFVAMSREGAKRSLTVVDDGDGIPKTMHGHVFEPRVTSKLDTSHIDAWGMHGRGMALYSISVNADDAEIMRSEVGLGCAIKVDVNTEKLSEKSDQSSFPTFTLADGGTVLVRGPRNILRTSCEFAIESRSTCSVYVGSPVEVAATLFYYGSATLSAIDKAFCRDVSQLPLSKMLATAGEPEELRALAQSMGLEMSERTARRIMNGEIAALDPILDCVEITRDNKPAAKKRTQTKQGRKAIRFDKNDANLLKSTAREAFGEIARRYYLEGDIEPQMRVSYDKITLTLPIIRKDD